MAKLEWADGDHAWVAYKRSWIVATAQIDDEDFHYYEIRDHKNGTFSLLHRGMTVNRKPLKSRELCEKLAQAIEDAVERVQA